MKEMLLCSLTLILIAVYAPNFAGAANDPCDFDADGDVDGADLEVFSQKYGTVIWYKDLDGDRYSDGETIYAMSQPSDYYLAAELTAIAGDCNDNDGSIHPGAHEQCDDGMDNDCDNLTDIDDPDCGPVCGDGFCTHSETAESCSEDCIAECDDGYCTHNENAGNCPADCPDVCGDDACTGDEDAVVCPDDCPSACGDGACTHMESTTTCPEDCPSE